MATAWRVQRGLLASSTSCLRREHVPSGLECVRCADAPMKVKVITKKKGSGVCETVAFVPNLSIRANPNAPRIRAMDAHDGLHNPMQIDGILPCRVTLQTWGRNEKAGWGHPAKSREKQPDLASHPRQGSGVVVAPGASTALPLLPSRRGLEEPLGRRAGIARFSPSTYKRQLSCPVPVNTNQIQGAPARWPADSPKIDHVAFDGALQVACA